MATHTLNPQVGCGFEEIPEPLEPHIRLLTVREIDSSPAVPMLSHDYRYNEMFIDETDLRSVVADPLVLRGVGGTTL